MESWRGGSKGESREEKSGLSRGAKVSQEMRDSASQVAILKHEHPFMEDKVAMRLKLPKNLK